jgi:Ca2+-binding RTX toxin-like protein
MERFINRWVGWRVSRVVVAAAAGGLAVAAASASAATRVSTTASGDIRIEDTAGATDAIAVGQEQAGSTFFVSVTELRFGQGPSQGAYLPTQPLQAGEGCKADIITKEAPAVDNGHPRVRCAVPDQHLTITASLGAGNDTIRFSRFASRAPYDVNVDGGSGNDDIAGCDGLDVLNGGDGNDNVRSRSDDLVPGGGGAFLAHDAVDRFQCSQELLSPAPTAPPATHTLSGGPGDDTLVDGDGQPDIYDGGDGTDTVALDTIGRFDALNNFGFFFFWTATIDGVANDVARNARNQSRPTDNILPNVENMTGNGRLTGNSNRNRIQGGQFADIIVGGSPPVANAGASSRVAHASISLKPLPLPVPRLVLVDDTLLGGGGDDALAGEGGNDSLNGEDGNDTLNGGDGADAMSGGDGDDTLRGGTGNDTLRGDNGNDNLDGQAGSDSYSGGAGADSIDSRDGEPDTISCGTGLDSVNADLKDVVSDDCENLEQGAIHEGPNVRIVHTSLKVKGGRVRVALRCPAGLQIGCRGTLSLLRVGGKRRTGGVARYSLSAGRTRIVRLRAGRADRRAIARRKKLRRRVKSVEQGSEGLKTTIRLVRLHR